MTNRQIILKSHPNGMPSENNFALRDAPKPQIKDGQVLIKTQFISVDPYMRKRMDIGDSYFDPFEINQPITGGVVGNVVESKSKEFHAGDAVLGFLEWGDYVAANATELKKLNPKLAPISTAIGVLGMPGMTAYFGLLEIGKPKSGETIVISGAAGAVGSLVGQIAKIKGCRTVGIVGSEEKANYIVKELGFDSAINYKKAHYAEELKKACPKGVDVYFDNVGGDITDQVLKLINKNARIPICGQISMYNNSKQDVGPRNFWTLLVNTATAQGFVAADYENRYPEGEQQMAKWIKDGKIKYRESIVNGLENAPKAFIGLFKGENIGKQIVKV